MTAPAGPGDFIDNDLTAPTLEGTNQECTYAVKVSGDSMEPKMHDGDIFLFIACKEIPQAHIELAWYKSACYCKKFIQKDGNLFLVSENKVYKPILIDSFDEYFLYGEAVEIIPANSSLTT